MSRPSCWRDAWIGAAKLPHGLRSAPIALVSSGSSSSRRRSSPSRAPWLEWSAGYSRADSAVFYDRLVRSLQTLPHVEAAGLFRLPLLMIWDFGRREFAIEGQSGATNETQQMSFNIIGGDHFRALRIAVIAGRDFARTDDMAAARVAIVNETLARRYWKTPEGALGRRVQTADWTTGVPTWMTIVGVARDIKYIRLNEPPMPYVYLPFQQASSSVMGLLVRSNDSRAALLAEVAAAVRGVDANVPVVESRMLEDQTKLGFSIYDVSARILGAADIAAACLAALGVYGMVAYTIKQRMKDIGIRMAIGAAPANIRRRFIAMGLQVGVAGVLAGLGLVLITARVIQSLLYGVSSTDATSLLVASAMVLAVVTTAAAIPAWRASRMDPIAVLRHS
jgi:hypothetical protein